MLSDTAEHLFQRGINEYAGSDLGRNEITSNQDEEIIDSGFNVEATFESDPCLILSAKKGMSLVFPRTRIVRYNTRTV